MCFINNRENLTRDQQGAVEAVENLIDKIRNHNTFSNTEIVEILSEVKRIHALYKKVFRVY